jgi:hypothetical protein
MDQLIADGTAARLALASSSKSTASPPASSTRRRGGWLLMTLTHGLSFCLGAGVTLAWANNLFDFGVEPVTAEENLNSAPQAASVERALELIRTAEERFRAVVDYECLFLRDEVIDGKMNQNVLRLKVRHEPFSVLMEWLDPAVKRGRKVAWVTGKNDGKMLVKQLITLKLDPAESIRKKESRHTILETGIKNLIHRYKESWEREAHLGLTTMTIDDREVRVSLPQRDFVHQCLCVTSRHPATSRGQFQYFYVKLYFDKATGLPMKTEVFDWPSAAHPDGQLVERYTYLDLKTNVGVKDADFAF